VLTFASTLALCAAVWPLARKDDTTPPEKTVTAKPLVNEEKLVFALVNFSHWKKLRELAGGETRTTWELATAGGCSYDAALKHLKLLRATGLVEQGRGNLYKLPAHFLTESGQP